MSFYFHHVIYCDVILFPNDLVDYPCAVAYEELELSGTSYISAVIREIFMVKFFRRPSPATKIKPTKY